MPPPPPLPAGYHIFSLCYVPPGKLLIGAGIESATQSPALLAISGDPLNGPRPGPQPPPENHGPPVFGQKTGPLKMCGGVSLTDPFR